ncbi:UPF0676 protein C1494.01 isoform X1 [Drosophila guanche]|uniref:UPF0676 protein C1494.01 isoform X1 n=1 Tax=Drosophila guanche TaxID=7266 RepID=UPI001470FE6C|nr:UPF0676 protein C1494.01 isoform X1 [Drosophila guanche]
MIKSKIVEDKLDTLVSRYAVPIIDLAHCGKCSCPIHTRCGYSPLYSSNLYTIALLIGKSVINRVGQQLDKALSEKGIALLVNHGIPDEKIKAAWDQFDYFLDLPAEVRDRYSRKDGTNYGYVSPGMERFDGKTPELRHTYNICKLDDKNIPREAETLPDFAEEITTLANDFTALSTFILKALEVALETPPKCFLDKHSEMLSGDDVNMTTLRMIYYPAIVDDEPGQSEGAVRCGAHVDYGTFTLLAQDSEGGLEVQLPGGDKWERVGHLPGSILINGGELLSIWTRERYHAVPHRVVVPERAKIRTRGRHSIAYFCHPDNSTMISPRDILANQTESAEESTDEKIYSAYELIQKKFSDTYGPSSQESNES